jgi:cysteine desulfurase / selenocysteine lyase
MTYDVDQLRKEEFPWAAGGESIYLNCASTGPLPRRTVEAVNRFTELRATPHRISHEMQFGTLTRSRELLAKLIGATPAEIGLATNTGFGINVAAWSLPLKQGDVVVGSRQEFPANVYPWMAAAKQRGFEFRMIAEPSQEALLEAMRAPGVKAVAISWVEFASGYRFDLAGIGAECRKRGIYFVVDAIQGLGPLTLDVRACHVDIAASGGQKWLMSPWGTGFTYVRRDLIASLEPGFVSWMGVRGSDDFAKLADYDLTWRGDARRFEFITLPFQEFAGMNASLELIFELGVEAVVAHTQSLTDRIVGWADARGFETLTPPDAGRRAGIVALRLPDSAEKSRKLQEAGIAHSLREGAIRLAPYFFNTAAEIDRALSVLSA